MMAAAMWTKPHVIAFDEPTNYLDFQPSGRKQCKQISSAWSEKCCVLVRNVLRTVNALAKAIKLFKGGTIVVTHNQDFLKETCDEIWNVEDGRVSSEGVVAASSITVLYGSVRPCDHVGL